MDKFEFTYRYDYSKIDRLDFKKVCISESEVNSIFESLKSNNKNFTGFDYIIGFSYKNKFIHIIYNISKNANFEIELLQIDLPHEEDIRKYFYKLPK